jgi:hypothetical protein
MAIGKDELIDVLRIRYDYASADAVFEQARQRAQLEDKRTFDAGELRAFCGALASVGDRLGGVLARLDQMIGEAPAAAAAPMTVGKVAKTEKSDKGEHVAKTEKSEKSDKVEKAAAKDRSGPQGAAATDTTIVLTGVQLGDSDQVLICGASAEIGDWDPERARPMSRKGDEWLTTVKLPADAKVAFKFLRRTSKGEVIWEDGDDRLLVATPRIEATWRSA